MKRISRTSLSFHAALYDATLVTSVPPQHKVQSPKPQSTPKPQPRAAADSESIPAPTPSNRGSELAGLHAVLKGIREMTDELLASRAQNLAELQSLAIELGVAIASHIVKTKVESNEFEMSELISDAFKELHADGVAVSVRLHPQDLENLQEVAASEHDLSHLSFEPDAELKRGSCAVTGGAHGLISTLQTRLDTIRETLLEGMEDARFERRKAVIHGKSLRRFPDRRKPA